MNKHRINHNFSPGNITELSRCEVFVFGSNLAGHHEGGAARTAYEKFGAQWGIGVGPTGQCYAIPTMHGGLDDIKPHVDQFIEYAKMHPMKRFLLTRIGCGIAGFRDDEMAYLFRVALNIPNIAIPKQWVPYMLADITLDLETPNGHKEVPAVVTENIIKDICQKHLYEIGAGLLGRMPKIRIRYVNGKNNFGYTNIENVFFLYGDDDGMYVWEKDECFAEDHNQDIVEEVFEDECKGRGYAHRVIFAGVRTGFKDSKDADIYTGDVIEIDADGPKLQLALGTFNDKYGYCFILDNHCLLLKDCQDKKLTRIGTVFYKLNWSEYPTSTIKGRTMKFNDWYDTSEEHKQKVMMSKFTPNFEQEDWKYEALETIGAEYHWNK